MPGPAGIDADNSKGIVAGVLQILRDGQGPEDSERWATVCSKSGHCIPACDYGVNPRFMLSMARTAMSRRKGEKGTRKLGVEKFQFMSRGERVLSRLQLPPDALARIRPDHAARRDAVSKPDIIFYTGCNIIKTPHIALLCLDVLDALGVTYDVMGGPSNCCGILQLRAGDAANAGRMGNNTIDKFSQTGVDKVVSWCPTCQIQMNEFLIPTREKSGQEKPFDTEMFAVFLDERLDQLKALMIHPVEKSVGLHEHSGTPGVNEAVRHILESIPGLEFVDLEQPPVGYMCNGLAAIPENKRAIHQRQLDAASAAGITTFAGIYHACHRELCGKEQGHSFEVVNFMELIGASMGICHEDIFKRLKALNDADLVIAETEALIEEYGLDPDDVRTIIIENALA